MSNNATRRVAKNTVIMYFRMIILVCISFVSSRLLLKTLGIEDYGIYSVVGSVTSTFVALKSLFSESIQRYLNFYKGKDDLQTQKEIFSLAIIIHVFLAIIFVVVLEIVGLWLINNKLTYPLVKYDTVLFVFHTSVVASAISIFCIPYDAAIIANEKMGFYAVVSILEGVFRLLVVLILPFLPYSSLKAYSLCLVVVPLTLLIVSFLYCRKFEECTYIKPSNKGLFKDFMSLSGWNFFGNITFSLLHEGINFILNIFGGLVYNAARAIAYQVKSITIQFSNNSMIAIRPLVMQSAAKDDDNHILFSNIIKVSRIAFFLVLLPIVTIETYCPELLSIWLTEVPRSTVLFTRLVLLGVLFRSLHEPLNMMYMSVGRVKRMIVCEALVMILVLFLIYIVLSQGAPLWISFAILALMEIVVILVLLLNAKKELIFPVSVYCKEVLLPFLYSFVFSCLIAFLFSLIKPLNVFLTLLLCVIVLSLTAIIILIFMNERERGMLKSFMKSKINLTRKRNVCN